MSGNAHMNQATNISMSIGLVRKELEATLNKAEGYFSRYAEEQDQAHLKLFADELNLVRGRFKLLELSGPESLVTEMLSLLGDGVCDANARIDALGHGLLNLINYMNLVLEQEFDHPVLLIPAINSVRKTGGHKPLTESHFFSVNLRPKLPVHEKSTLNLKPHLPRLRLMYQAGLLRMLKGKEPLVGLKLIQRSLVLLERGFRGTMAWPFWWCCKCALDAMVEEEYELTQSRKMLFVRIDFIMKGMIKEGAQILTGSAANELHKDLLYLIALSSSQTTDMASVKSTFKLPSSLSEKQLKEDRRQLAGPSIGAYESLSGAFKEEINSIKEALDYLGRNSLSEEGLEALKTRIKALSGVLRVIYQQPLSELMDQQLQSLASMSTLTESDQLAVLAQMAEAMLQLELASTQFALGQVEHDGGVIGAGHYSEARIVLFDEIASGLTMAKRAVAAYVDDSDKLHLANITPVLTGVWGALVFLSEHQAAKIVQFSLSYLNEKVLNADSFSIGEARLEVLADALTSVEYYVETMSHSGAGATDILSLAIKSVGQLGYKMS